ncbi:GGDEF domain-containing protein [Deinococcus psychrotolerans]|uniref:GGDEF domain-containing protein n=1 Tax=Deinococcus psychrotolerans TaxID=2489213 RepID=A0A3G8YFN3_9DEIO|nr:GGDEF domain-containing protein [Deinococcus psychrotolerans]AZI44102.1 GGDEF domain-containing protein [Deinococcus psychrotolerans]
MTQLNDRRALLLDAGRPFEIRSLVLLDIDGFKAVNDALGHAAGDAALCMLARLLESAAHRWGARAYRLGGDEFVLLSSLPLNAQQLIPVQAHFKQALRTLGSVENGSFSYGLAQAPFDGQTLTALLRQADTHLSTHKTRRCGEGTGPLRQLLGLPLDAAGQEHGGRRCGA